MKAHIIYAHPNPESFNHAIMQRVQSALVTAEVEHTISDLYAMNFNPVLRASDVKLVQDDVLDEQQKITKADFIIIIYPVWWTQMPAILKGYVDRVFAYNFAFQLNESGFPIQLLQGRKGIVISTFGSPEEFYESKGYLAAFEKTVDTGILEYVGIACVAHLHFGNIARKSNQERKVDLARVESLITAHFNNK